MGIVVGGLLAMGATVAQRELVRRAGSRLIDWEAVRGIARRRLGAADVRLTADERAAAEAFYREALIRIEPIVADEIGAQLPAALERPAVIDRREWIDLNLATFEVLFARVEHILQESAGSADTPGRALARILNRSLGNQQLGFLMAFLARKVLGQYDLSLLAAGPATRGRLHLVEPNIVGTANAMRLPLSEFRTFIALHEATHAFEFEAYPWLREHFSGLVAESVEQFAAESGGLGARLRQALAGRTKGHWLERMMTPGFVELHDRFERRNESRSAIERAIMRITGLDLKMEQYVAGERFVGAVLAQRDRAFLNRVWQGPQQLPSLEEIRQPDRWISRIESIGAEGNR
jgi:uncharacterized protein (DUF2342 family)